MELITVSNVAIGVIVAIVILAAIDRDIRRRRREHREWVGSHTQITGVVDRVNVSDSFESGTSYTPVIEYTLPDGQRYAVDGETSSFPVMEVGSEVLIAYDPAMPSTARLVEPPSWKQGFSCGDAILFAVIATIATVIAGFIRR
jgi:hypothetical protein